ncbi:MAG TPA: hypothetical protein VM243_20225 [Phycisphaerae bacterium]|nr:hypothetical protein [Phycisphaerae bacterium]
MRTSARNALLIALVVVAGLLACSFAFCGGAGTDVGVPPNVNSVGGPYDPAHIDGIETDEQPEFNVAVEARLEGTHPVLEFSITETHGWAVTHLYIEASHGFTNEETGEWEPNSALRNPPRLLCKGYVEFGKTLVDKTTLTTIEMMQIDHELGTSENWRARVYKWGRVYQPR